MSKVFKAVGNAITGVVKGVVKAVTSVVKAVVGAVASVVKFVAQPFMGIFGGAPEINDGAEQARQKGVLIQTTGSIESVPVIYGYRQVAGIVPYVETGSTDNKYLYVAYVFSEGPVNGLHDVYINDIQINPSFIADLNAGKEVSVDDTDNKGRFKDRVILRWSPGVFFPTASSSTLGQQLKAGMFSTAPNFSADMVFNGLACLFARYEWKEYTDQAQADKNPFDGSIPRIRAGIQGRRVASLETSASENYEYGAAGYTERYSTNPAEIILDVLRNPRYGKGLKNDEIDWSSFRVACSKLNTRVDYTSVNRGPIITCNYVLDTGQTIMNNIKILLQGARAYMPYVQGRYKLKIEDAGNPTSITSGSAYVVAECSSLVQIRDASLIDNQYDIMGDITYTGIDRNAKYNQVVVSWVNPADSWSVNQVTYPESESERQDYIDADGGRVNKQEVTFPTLTNYFMARDMARLLFNKSRYQESCSIRVSSQAMELEPGDIIRIQAKILNFQDIPWRVVSIGYNDDYTFDLNCVRCPDFMYPYTEANAPDVVRPIYIPRGSTIYLPEGSTYDYGLYPPVTVPIADDIPPSNTDLNPIPGDPITEGGGVGGSGSIENETGQNIDAIPVSTPIDPSDVIDVLSITYERINDVSYYAVLTWRQPTNAMYSGVAFYWRQTYAVGGPWTRQDILDVVGAGNTITGKLGPFSIATGFDLAQSGAQVIARVKYSGTPYFSDKAVSFGFTPDFASGFVTTPSETVSLFSNLASTLNLFASVAPRRDNVPKVLGRVTSLTNPRNLTLLINQQVGSGGELANGDIIGVNIYYRNTSETNYRVLEHRFSSSYAAGSTASVSMTNLVGTPSDPITYDIIVRFYYKDGTESTRQFRDTFYVQTGGPYGAYPFTNFDTRVTWTGEAVTAYSFNLVSAAEEAEVLNSRLGVDFVRAELSGTTRSIKITMVPPPAGSNRLAWRGVRMRWRPVLEGRAPAFQTIDSLTTVIDDQTGLTLPYSIDDIAFDQRYEVVITPLIFYNNSVVEGNWSLIARSYLHNFQTRSDYPADGNWAPAWSFAYVDTPTALGELNQRFEVGSPTVDVVSFDGYRLAVGPYIGYSKWYTNYPTDRIINCWLSLHYGKLVYDHRKLEGLGYDGLYVYRRNVATPSGANSRYYGYGRWERFLITDTNVSGNITLFVRPPTSYKEFASATTATPGQLASVAGKPTGTTAIADEKEFNSSQWLLVARFNGVASDKGLLITIPQNVGRLVQNPSLNYCPFVAPTVVDVAQFDSDFDAGYNRRLSEYRENLTASQTWLGQTDTLPSVYSNTLNIGNAGNPTVY